MGDSIVGLMEFMVRSLNSFLEEMVLSKRPRSKLLSPGIQIALSQ